MVPRFLEVIQDFVALIPICYDLFCEFERKRRKNRASREERVQLGREEGGLGFRDSFRVYNFHTPPSLPPRYL
jgi:hypothetical protein